MELRRYHRVVPAFVFFVAFAVPCAAIPRTDANLPFVVTDFPMYHLYWFVSFGVIVAAISAMIKQAVRVDERHLWNIVYYFSVMLIGMSADYVGELNHGNALYDDVSRLGSSLSSCLLIFIFSRLVEAHRFWRFRSLGRFWGILAGILMLQYVVDFSVFYSIARQPGQQYFDRNRIVPSVVLDAALISVGLYYCAVIFWERRMMLITGRERVWLGFGAIVTFFFAPIAILVDYERRLFPALWALYPQDDLFVLPAFKAVVSIILAVYCRSYAQGSLQTRPATVTAGISTESATSGITDQSAPPVIRGFSELTSREREVALLLAQGFSYKEVGARLHMSMGTVQTHVTHVYAKLGVNCKEHLMLRMDPQGISAMGRA